MPKAKDWAEISMQLLIAAAPVYRALAIPRDARRFYNYASPVPAGAQGRDPAEMADGAWPKLQVGPPTHWVTTTSPSRSPPENPRPSVWLDVD